MLGFAAPGVAAGLTARKCQASVGRSLALAAAAIAIGTMAALVLGYGNLLWMSSPVLRVIESPAAEEAARKIYDPEHNFLWLLLHQLGPIFGFTSLIGAVVGLWFGRDPSQD